MKAWSKGKKNVQKQHFSDNVVCVFLRARCQLGKKKLQNVDFHLLCFLCVSLFWLHFQISYNTRADLISMHFFHPIFTRYTLMMRSYMCVWVSLCVCMFLCILLYIFRFLSFRKSFRVTIWRWNSFEHRTNSHLTFNFWKSIKVFRFRISFHAFSNGKMCQVSFFVIWKEVKITNQIQKTW